MNKPLVIILMGSKADLSHCEKIKAAAGEFELDVAIHIASAHKTPEHTMAILKKYENSGQPRVYITVAGRSNALSGFTDGAVAAPVIACPPPSDSFGGGDIYSSLRMPSGIAPGVVLDAGNAALLAAKILGLCNSAVLEKVTAYQQKNANQILGDDLSIQD